MSNARSIVAQRSFWPNLAWAGFVASVVLQGAQSTVPVDHSAYFGAWTLNRELSSAARTPDGSDGHGRESGGGRGGRGHGGGGGGFGRRGGGGGRGSGGSASFDPEEREKVMALMQELMTPTPHWVL